MLNASVDGGWLRVPREGICIQRLQAVQGATEIAHAGTFLVSWLRIKDRSIGQWLFLPVELNVFSYIAKDTAAHLWHTGDLGPESYECGA